MTNGTKPKFKVFGSVIDAVAVQVVDRFSWPEWAAKFFGHNEPVFGNPSCSDADSDVPAMKCFPAAFNRGGAVSVVADLKFFCPMQRTVSECNGLGNFASFVVTCVTNDGAWAVGNFADHG